MGASAFFATMQAVVLGGLVLVLFSQLCRPLCSVDGVGHCSLDWLLVLFLFSGLQKTYLDLGHLTTLERRWIIDCSVDELSIDGCTPGH